jgi:hypothetical protein
VFGHNIGAGGWGGASHSAWSRAMVERMAAASREVVFPLLSSSGFHDVLADPVICLKTAACSDRISAIGIHDPSQTFLLKSNERTGEWTIEFR